MSSQVTYFTSIDSQYRDDNQYPLETDFGVSFKIKDPYATYPDGTFFYPSAQQESQNTGAYNPPGLNPGIGIITGSNIPYAKGTPVDSTQTFPRITIDKNYVDSPIVVKGGKIFQMVETPNTTITGNYTVTFCGIIEPDVDTYINFGIIVDNIPFWEYRYTGSAYNSLNYSYPFICTVTYNIDNKLQPGQLIIMNPVNGSIPPRFNSTKYVDIQYTDDNKNIFMMFDFTLTSFYLARVNPITGINVNPIDYGLVTNLPNQYYKLEQNINGIYRQISKEVSQAIIIGFNSDLENLAEYENFPWGSHQFFTSPNPIDILPSRNGFNQTRVDKANNIYAAVHIDPFDVNYSIVTIPAPYVPIIGYVGGSPASRNSQPLGHTINLESSSSSYTYRNIIFCSSGAAGSTSSYDTTLVFSDTTDILQNPPDITPYVQTIGIGYGTNSAAFFGTGVNGNCLIAYNNFNTSSPTDGLQIVEISGAAGSGIITPKTSALANSFGVYVTAVDAYNTPLNTDFGGLPIVVAIRGNNQISGNHDLYVYKYDNSTSTLTQLASQLNASNGEGCCIVKIIQTTVPDSQLFIALGTVKSSAVRIYRYDTGGTLTFISETIFPNTILPLGATQAQISQIYTYNVENDYTALGVTFDQKTYLALYEGTGLEFNFKLENPENPILLENKATYNIPFTTTTSDGIIRYYMLGSNIYTSVGNVYSANILGRSLLDYQIGKDIDIQNLGSYPENSWYSFLNGYYFGFTRSETNYSANRIYLTQSTAYNSSTFYGYDTLVSKHSFITTRNSGLTLETTPIGSSAFTWMSPVETNTPMLVCPTTYGNIEFYDLSTYPIITNQTTSSGTFSSSSNWVTFDTSYNGLGQGSMFIAGCNGTGTYFTNCINYSLSTVYSVSGAISTLYGTFPNNQSYVFNMVNNPNPTVEMYDISDGLLINSAQVGTAPTKIVSASFIYFENSTLSVDKDYLALILYTGSVFQLRFFNCSTFTLLPTLILPLDLPTTYQDIRCSNVFNPSANTIELFIEAKVSVNGRATILTYHLPADSTLLDNIIFNIDNSRLQQNLQLYGENLSSTNNFLRNQILMSAFVDNAFGSVNFVAIYDTTNADEFVRIAEIPCNADMANYAQQTMYTFSTGKTLLFTCTRADILQGGEITIFDITNPALAGQYINGTTELENTFSESIDGKGSANIVSISAGGSTNWINNIGDTNIPKGVITDFVFEDPAYYESQFINITGLDIDAEQLNLYLSTDWQTKIAVNNPHTTYTGGSQLVLRYDQPSLSNSSVIKIATNNGNSVYLTPIQGSNNVYSIDIIKGQNTVIGLNLYGTSTFIYETQFATTNSNFILPSIIQSVINTNSPNNTSIVSFDSIYSTFQWTNKIETTNLSTYVFSTALGYNDYSVYLIGNTNSNQIDFYSSGIVSQFWKENPFIGANDKLPVPIVFISKYDYNGNYLESDIMDTLSNVNTIPSYVHVGVNDIYAVSNITYFEPTFTFLPRNKDGSLGNVINLDNTFTGANDSLITTNTTISLTTRYKINSNYIDSNGKEYSILTVYNSNTGGDLANAFIPYSTDPSNTLVNKYVYIPSTNSNYTVRSNFYDSSSNTYNVVLNEIIQMNTLTRLLPAYIIYPTITPADTTNREYYGYFYTANLANGKTYAFSEFNKFNSTTLGINTSLLIDTSLQYYIITNDTLSSNQIILPIRSIINNPTGFIQYQATVENTNLLSLNGWGWLTTFNPNALYTLQFYPASLTEIIYYTVRLNNLTIPNRAIRNSTITGGPRYLTDYRYIWLEIYNADDFGNPDPEIVNNTFSNNPNRNAKVIFQIPITSAGGFSNYSFLFSSQAPRLKFNPGFYNIRIRLLDPNNNVIIFENSPSPNNSEDNVFSTQVDNSLMNITVDLELTNILRA